MRGAARSPFKFSQTTHHIMITEKTDVDLSDKLQGKALSEILGLSPDFRFHIQKGVKLQPLESSTESEGKENVIDVNVPVGLRNESSAETDTMDMDVFQENYLPGVASSSSRKCLKGKSQKSQAADASARVEMEGRPLNGVVCDLNHPLPDLPALASPMGCGETSSSRTQSLDIEQLLSDAEQPGTSKPSGCQDGPLGPEPSSRWAKRLKLSSSGSAYGIKSSKMGEAPTHEEGNKFRKILKCGIAGSEPSLGRCHGKEQMELGQNAMLIRKGGSSSVDSGQKSQYVTLSHPWIRRWCHNRVASPRRGLRLWWFVSLNVQRHH
ncbi:F-box protein At2g16365-like [Juglans microcarpa x Juglans regia]|uniref:F-box protein At2g16365-like n=1 Tax=Juglans microcarpa x Juglans regia TaxID=2249226 RepID=UPI001B7DF0D2|nr:F-box protein At2g16365-like [Juglans microcarpa x Juglans regia]